MFIHIKRKKHVININLCTDITIEEDRCTSGNYTGMIYSIVFHWHFGVTNPNEIDSIVNQQSRINFKTKESRDLILEELVDCIEVRKHFLEIKSELVI